MRNYFLLSVKYSPELASAFTPDGTKLAHELIFELNGIDELPFELGLIKLSGGKNGLVRSNDLTSLNEIWLDYQPNSLAWPLMSEKLKAVISKKLTGKEYINWITAKINGNGEQRIYYIPRFERMLDVLDKQKTIYIKGTDRIIKPYFSLTKISAFNLFHQPAPNSLWQITSGLYISDVLKKAIEKEKLTGVDFEKTTVA